LDFIAQCCPGVHPWWWFSQKDHNLAADVLPQLRTEREKVIFERICLASKYSTRKFPFIGIFDISYLPPTLAGQAKLSVESDEFSAPFFAWGDVWGDGHCRDK
jgi:hypothetical protein